MDFRVLLLVILNSKFCSGAYKRWLSNTNFGNPSNWNAGRSPCGNDVVVIHEESAAVFLQINTTIKELVMPKTGEVVLGSDVVLAFTEQPDHSAHCTPVSTELEFNVTYPRDWFDANNWCEADSETGDCKTVARLDTERVPCEIDDVVYPKRNSYYVNLETGLEITVKTLKITGKAYTTNTFDNFLMSAQGKRMFPPPTNNKPRSTVSVSRRPCTDSTGCACGNHDKTMTERICAIQGKRCQKVQCRTPLNPLGHCCDVCGGVLVAKYGTGFRYDTLVNGVRRNFIDGKDDFKEVTFIASKVEDGMIQMVFTDLTGDKSSQLAKAVYSNLQQDINSGGFKYSLLSIIMDTSSGSGGGPSAGAQKSDHDEMPGGEIAGIVVGIGVVMVVVLLAAFFVYRRKTSIPADLGFKVFDKISFKKPNFRKPRVEVPPSFGFRFGGPENVGPSQGFDNPMYGNNPLENEKPIDMEMMPSTFSIPVEEQPTFDTSRGFDNPLYDNSPQESMFSDPSNVETTDKSTVDNGLPSPTGTISSATTIVDCQ